MALSWNEIKDRAVSFSKEWEGTERENADAKPFLVDFFKVFGITSKKVATFEEPMKKLDKSQGFIDLFWKGMILVEMKSRGKDLDKAFKQAMEYLETRPQHELPKYILVCDFDTFRLTDLDDEEKKTVTFKLKDFVKNVQHFGLIAGYQKRTYKEQDPVNIYAAELMGKLHDKLESVGYKGHALEVYLVRALFCLFADDTGIFEPVGLFDDYIRDRTSEDGKDLAPRLSELFHVLNTPREERLTNLDEQLMTFPYVNGKLFEESLPPASFDKKMRETLLECCTLNWGKISPAIFGSMFQSVMDDTERRNLGAHYTSEKNIMKVIRPLFLDDLFTEFNVVKGNAKKLNEFHKKLSTLNFLDPACGCGNFLIITYRELRLLELEVLRELRKSGQGTLNVRDILWIDVDQCHGIEFEEFPARIAEVAMWLVDHQMNMAVSEEFGQYFIRLPLKKSAHIVHGDALKIKWESVVPHEKLSFILGNPPFIGSKIMKQEQRDEIVGLFDSPGSGVLDYVTGWYIKAAKYIQGTDIKVAFVSTNSITQGEQVSVLWGKLLNTYHIKIHFAHRTFKWSNEAKGNAAVFCVIIGFANFETKDKVIFDYEDVKGEPHELKAANINPYLVDAKDILIEKRSTPISKVPKMNFGNMPLDGGNLLLDKEEKDELVKQYPQAKQFLKRTIGSQEYINNQERWCLWLVDANPSDLKKIPPIIERINKVKKFRESSIAPSTRNHAVTPSLFRDRNLPKTYIVVPGVSSERRKYIPMGLLNDKTIPTNLVHIVPNGNLYHFGVLTSKMHMAWVNSVCGRLESRYRYSKDIVYNNYPFPDNPSGKQIKSIEEAAQNVLDVRSHFPDNSLADLYDPNTMPSELVKAHQQLDKAVDLAYRSQPFTSDLKRMELLLDLYEKMTGGLFVTEKPKRKTSRSI